MSAAEHVHWHEGLFLQPHHLQAMQRRLGEQIAAAAAMVLPYPYGLLHAELAPDAIQNRQIRFERLRLIMRSGLEIDVPGNTDLPPLELGRTFDSATGPVTVSIGVPLWYPSRANAPKPGETQDGRAKLIYRLREVQAFDENTGENPQQLLVRRINARLLLDGDDRSDLDVLPLFKLVNPAAGAVGLPDLDDRYFPPCLLITGWNDLFALIKDLVDQLQATRDKVARDISRDGFDMLALRPAQLKQLFRLATLNRFAASLPSLIRAPKVTPFNVYLELRELLGALSASDPTDPFDAPEYDHDDPAVAFKDLAERIREAFKDDIVHTFVPYELKPEGKMLQVVRGIAAQHLDLPEYYFGVETREDRSRVVQLVEDPLRFKMLPASEVKRVAQRGVRLVLDHNPPGDLRSAAGLSYFRVLRNDNSSQAWWEKIKAEGALGVTWLGLELPEARMTLYGMVPR